MGFYRLIDLIQRWIGNSNIVNSLRTVSPYDYAGHALGVRFFLRFFGSALDICRTVKPGL